MNARENWIPRLMALALMGFLWGEIVPWAWAASTISLSISLLFMWRRWNPPPRALTSALALLSGAMIYLPAGTFIGRDPSAALLGVLAGLKALESRDTGDERAFQMIGLFLVVVLFLFRADLWSFLVGVGAVAIFLTGVLRDQPKGLPTSLARAWAWRLSWRSAPLALILFLVVPRLQHAGWWGSSPTTRTGFREELDPGRSASLEEDLTPVFRATWSPRVPREPIFWRGAVLERTDGFSWLPSARTREEMKPVAGARGEGTTPYHVEWILEDQGGRWIFVPEGARAVRESRDSAPRAILHSPETGVWKWATVRQERTRLEADVDLRDQRRGAEDPRLLAIPPSGPVVQEWIRRLKEGGGNRFEIVRRLIVAFRDGGFIYTRQPGTMKTLDDFLTAKRGYCEHYASSTALLLRGAGVPARVVVGYLGGEWNPIGEFQVVTRADAHSWVEWLNEKGIWSILDTTAVVPLADPSLLERQRNMNLAPENATWWERLRWQVDTVNYGFAALLMNFTLDSQKELWNRWGLSGWSLGLSILFSMFALVALARLASGLWSAREPASLRHYRRWLDRGLARGWNVAHESGPLDNLRRAREAAPEESDRSEAIVARYVKARYGRSSPANFP